MTKMRAKMQLHSIEVSQSGEKLKFSAVCKTGGYSDSGLDEDNTYAKFTPSASLEIYVSNPELHGKFKPGEKYYVDFTLADK